MAKRDINMNMRTDIIATRIADEDTAYKDIANDLATNYSSSELLKKHDFTRGDKVSIEAVMGFKEIVSCSHYVTGDLIYLLGEEKVVEIFKNVFRANRGKIENEIKREYKENPPMNRIFDGNEDDYEDGKVRNLKFYYGKVKVNHGKIYMPGTINLLLTAVKLPDLSEGPYTEMSDSQLKTFVGKWADISPDSFWMDGEYRGSYMQRVKGLMKQLRFMTPNQQVKHKKELERIM